MKKRNRIRNVQFFSYLGNGIVLAIGILKKKYRNNVTNCYIMNLAITDLLFLLLSVPFTIYLAVRNVWIFGEFLCKMHIYLAHVRKSLYFIAFDSLISISLGSTASYMLYISRNEYRSIFECCSWNKLSTISKAEICIYYLYTYLDRFD